ncbi:MAG: hypothetical protein ABEJ87_00955 [Candidatus Nanohalobium sp.]
MNGQKAALGLFLVLAIGSGCAGMTGRAAKPSSFKDLDLNLAEVENATGTQYVMINDSERPEYLNFSSTWKEIGSLFERDSNLSEAPETIQSMVMAMNGSEKKPVSGLNTSDVEIKGFKAQKLDRGNKTVLYGQQGNVSFIVSTKGKGGGIYSSAKNLYISIAKEAKKFDW